MEIVRKMPFPYKAIVCISNDIDGLTYSEFLETHRFLNTAQETAHGTGIDLDIGDSFWFFSAKPEINDSFTYFEGIDPTRSPYAEVIQEMAELGYLDCLHTWGNFNQFGGFRRSHAERAEEAMRNWKRRPLIWMDHGDIHNLQNLGVGLGDLPFLSDGMGKKQRVVEYHADLMTQSGICFVWTTKDVTSVWGQERNISRRENWRHQTGDVSLGRSIINAARALLNSMSYEGVLSPYELRDGQKVMKFQRYLKNWKSTGSNDLGEILSVNALDNLERKNAVACILVHLGFGERFADLTPQTVSAIRNLSKRQQDGRILVMSTARLLLYLYSQKYIQITTVREKAPRIYRLEWPVGTPSAILSLGAEALHNFTFYTDDPDNCLVEFQKQHLVTHINVPDETNRRSITLKTWRRPPFPYRELVEAERRSR